MNIMPKYQELQKDDSYYIGIGFSTYEIATVARMYQQFVKPTPTVLQNMGLGTEQSRRLRYLYDIYEQGVTFEDAKALAAHYRKLNKNAPRLGIQDIAISTVTVVPRKAVVAGIDDETFGIYNSINFIYPEDRLYEVVSAGPSYITIKTKIKPILKYKQEKKIDGVIEIVDLTEDGSCILKINTEFCRLTNRFVVVASFRRPEFHYGMWELVCPDGTVLYIVALPIGTAEHSRYNTSSQRVYSYGYLPNEIHQKLFDTMVNMYDTLHAVQSFEAPPNCEFRVIDREEKDELTKKYGDKQYSYYGG